MPAGTDGDFRRSGTDSSLAYSASGFSTFGDNSRSASQKLLESKDGKVSMDQLPELIELYRRDGMVEIGLRDWQAALCIFREEGWQPIRVLGSYVHPLGFVTQDDGKAMQRAGQSLFAKIDRQPALSVSVPIDLGMLYRLTEFVGGGAFIVGKQGAYANAKANDF